MPFSLTRKDIKDAIQALNSARGFSRHFTTEPDDVKALRNFEKTMDAKILLNAELPSSELFRLTRILEEQKPKKDSPAEKTYQQIAQRLPSQFVNEMLALQKSNPEYLTPFLKEEKCNGSNVEFVCHALTSLQQLNLLTTENRELLQKNLNSIQEISEGLDSLVKPWLNRLIRVMRNLSQEDKTLIFRAMMDVSRDAKRFMDQIISLYDHVYHHADFKIATSTPYLRIICELFVKKPNEISDASNLILTLSDIHYSDRDRVAADLALKANLEKLIQYASAYSLDALERILHYAPRENLQASLDFFLSRPEKLCDMFYIFAYAEMFSSAVPDSKANNRHRLFKQFDNQLTALHSLRKELIDSAEKQTLDQKTFDEIVSHYPVPSDSASLTLRR
jgi:hypothetical protein